MDRKLSKTIVVAKYKEDLSWLGDIHHVVIEKDKDVPNIGREPSSYVWYILQNYESLDGVYFFLQGDPRDHCPNIMQELSNTEGEFRWFSNRGPFKCDMMARPHDNVNISLFLERIDIEYQQAEIQFMGCCLFMVTGDKLKTRPKEFYQKLYDVLMKNDRSEYAFERCIGLIFNDNEHKKQ